MFWNCQERIEVTLQMASFTSSKVMSAKMNDARIHDHAKNLQLATQGDWKTAAKNLAFDDDLTRRQVKGLLKLFQIPYKKLSTTHVLRENLAKNLQFFLNAAMSKDTTYTNYLTQSLIPGIIVGSGALVFGATAYPVVGGSLLLTLLFARSLRNKKIKAPKFVRELELLPEILKKPAVTPTKDAYQIIKKKCQSFSTPEQCAEEDPLNCSWDQRADNCDVSAVAYTTLKPFLEHSDEEKAFLNTLEECRSYGIKRCNEYYPRCTRAIINNGGREECLPRFAVGRFKSRYRLVPRHPWEKRKSNVAFGRDGRTQRRRRPL